MDSGLRFSTEGEILHVSFYKPHFGNSLGVDEAAALQKALKTSKSKVRALLWTSEHPTLFCGGGDLKHHAKLKSKAQGLAEFKKIAAALMELAHFPVPKAAVINGDCLGGGMELLSCFDYRIAEPHVLFGFWQRRLSLSFGWGGYERWLEHVPAGVIKQKAFSGQAFGATEALRLGFVSAIGSSEWLAHSSNWTPSSGKAIADLDVSNEQKLFASLWWSDAHRAAISKFSKR